MIIQGTPLPASAPFAALVRSQSRIVSLEPEIICFPEGKAFTTDTAPDEKGSWREWRTGLVGEEWRRSYVSIRDDRRPT